MPLLFDGDAFKGLPKREADRLVKKAEWIWENREVVTHMLLRRDLHPFLVWPVGAYRLIYTYDAEFDEMIVDLGSHTRDIYQRAS